MVVIHIVATTDYSKKKLCYITGIYFLIFMLAINHIGLLIMLNMNDLIANQRIVHTEMCRIKTVLPLQNKNKNI